MHLFTSNSDIKKIVVKLSIALMLFWCISFIAYLGIDYMYFNSCLDGPAGTRHRAIQKKYDVYIFGASRAENHYDPSIISDQLGLTCFNLGNNSKNTNYQLGLLKLLISRHTPKLIIYELGDFLAHLSNGTDEFYPYYYHNNEIRKMVNSRDKLARIKLLLPLYTFNRKIYPITRDFLFPARLISSGFEPRNGIMLSAEIEKYRVMGDYEPSWYKIDQTAIASFKEFVDICQERNIELVLSFSPTYLPSSPSGLKEVTDIASRYRIPIYLYGERQEFNFNPNLFKDAYHLNSEGADMFTNLFVKDLHRLHSIQVKSKDDL